MIKVFSQRKIMTVVVIFTIIISAFTTSPEYKADEIQAEGYWSDFASDGFSGGDGTTEKPYQISSAEELAYFAVIINEGGGTDNEFARLNYTVTSDINLLAHQWVPIGIMDIEPQQTHYESTFYGTFDGGNHKITGLTITYTMDKIYNDIYEQSFTDNYYAGLFGFVTGANIKNIILQDVYIDTDMPYAGPLAGMLYMRAIDSEIREVHVDNCKLGGTVKSTAESGSYVGGIAGVWETMGNHIELDENGNTIQYCHGIFVTNVTALCNINALFTGVLGGMVYRPGGLHNTYYTDNIRYSYDMNTVGTAQGGVGIWFGCNKNYGVTGSNGQNISGWDANNYVEEENYSYNQIKSITPVYPVKIKDGSVDIIVDYAETGDEIEVNLTDYFSAEEIADIKVNCKNVIKYTVMPVNFEVNTSGSVVFTVSDAGDYIISIEPELLLGDINNDGTVNAADYIELRNFIINADSETESSSMDLNSDGKINSLDMVSLKKLIISI